MKIATISYPLQGDSVFLAMKKIKHGAGFLNGYGGKVEDGESIPEGAAREVNEEAGIKVLPADMEEVAVIDFYDGDLQIFECHVFFVRKWTGDFIETDEMAYPQAYPLNRLPLDQMWKGDRDWLPLIFSGKKIRGKAFYKKGMKEWDRFEYVPL